MPVTVISVWVVVLIGCLLGRWSVGCSAAHESGADLGQDVDAVGVGVDHLLHATHLALDAAQPLQVVVLAAGVSSHGTSSSWSTGYPSGVFPPSRTAEHLLRQSPG